MLSSVHCLCFGCAARLLECMGWALKRFPGLPLRRAGLQSCQDSLKPQPRSKLGNCAEVTDTIVSCSLGCAAAGNGLQVGIWEYPTMGVQLVTLDNVDPREGACEGCGGSTATLTNDKQCGHPWLWQSSCILGVVCNRLHPQLWRQHPLRGGIIANALYVDVATQDKSAHCSRRLLVVSPSRDGSGVTRAVRLNGARVALRSIADMCSTPRLDQ